MNGDDTFPWAKKPAVPDNRKRAVSKKTIEKVISSKLCQKCALQGIASPIHLFQINDEEALLMCKNADCTFMPSSNWESLIVKRSISNQPLTTKKKRSSSLSSQISTKSDKNKRNAAKGTSKSISQLRYSSPSLASSSSWLQTLPQQSSDVAASKSSVQKFLVTPSCPPDVSLEGKERKTLVPIAPFLNGHAHSFSSFQTNKLENKLLQRKALQAHHLIPSSTTHAKDYTVTYIQNRKTGTENGSILGNKRRAGSLDSDSLSSVSSSLDSRPTTPVSESVNSGKKVRRIVVPPSTISKLLDGSMKLEIRKSDKTGADVVFRSVKKADTTVSYSNSSEKEASSIVGVQVNGHNSGNTLKSGSLCSNITSIRDSDIVGDNNLEITEVGSLHDIISSAGAAYNLVSLTSGSDSTNSHIEAINFQLQADSIKSHIEAINQHIQAINRSVGRSDICRELDFSQLCQKFGTEIRHEPTTSPSSEVSRWLSNTDLRSDSGSNDTDSSQSSTTSFTPVGHIETLTSVSAAAQWNSNTSTPSSFDSEDFDELFAHNSHASLLISDTHLKNPFNDILNP